MSTTVTGLEQVTHGLDGMATDVDELDGVLGEVGRFGEERAAGYAPVRTGRLSHGIQATVTSGRLVISTSRDTVSYAGRMEARDHYMARALDDVEREAPDLTEAGVDEQLRRNNLR